MERDYAKRMLAAPRPKKKRGKWIAMFMLGLGAIALTAYIYKENLQGNSLSQVVQNVVTALRHKKVHVGHMATSGTQHPVEPDIHFDFYTELPNVQVQPSEPLDHPAVINPPSSVGVTPTPTAPQFILQIAAFKDEITASEFRISLLLAGFDANIVKAEANHQIFYRIQQGPYPSVGQAKVFQAQLAKKGFKSDIRKL